MWFIFALIATLGWGMADLFYKKSNDTDRYSHLKTAVWVGLVMGVTSVCLLPFSEMSFSFSSLLENAVKYLPASLGYIISMVIGYAGLRYLELSIVSPVQNASGAMSMIAMAIFFAVTGRLSYFIEDSRSAGNAPFIMNIAGTVIIVVGVIMLAVIEKRQSSRLDPPGEIDKKYRLGALALIFPLLYCLFDTIGTAADGIILDEETGLGLGEIDVVILYGLTFFFAAVAAWIFLLVKTGKPYNPFRRSEKNLAAAAVFEEFGQIFYVYAMARNPLFAAPMIASYCIVSVILSRLLLKEKLTKPQYACVFSVIAGILLLGIAEGIAEAA